MTHRNHDTLPSQIGEILLAEPLWAVRVANDPSFQPERVSAEMMGRFRHAARELKKVDGTELRASLEELLTRPDPRTSLRWLSLCGVMEHVLPEVHATLHLSQEGGRLHKDVWEHTLLVVFQAPSRPVLRWAALFHDIGKVDTRVIRPQGKVQFLGHAEKGATMVKRITRRLAFPRDMARSVQFLVLKHLRASQYDGQWNDSAVRRFYREIGDHLEDLLDLSRADITTARASKKAHALKMIDALSDRIERLKEEDARVPPLPSGLGNHIMERFQIAPGPLIGKLRGLLITAVEKEELQHGREAEYYLDYLKTHEEMWRKATD